MIRRLICRLVGHKRGQREGGQYYRAGRWRNRWYPYCRRCGTSDIETVYTPGIFEAFTPWRIRIAFYGWTSRFWQWRRRDCCDCGKPVVRFGRTVGNHEDCNEIPF